MTRRAFPTTRLPTVWPVDETEPAHPNNRYAESKVFNEQQCRNAAGDAMQVFAYRFPWVMPMRASEKANRMWHRADETLHEGFWTYLDLKDAVEAYVRGLEPSGVDRDAIGRFEAFHFVSDEAMGGLPIRDRPGLRVRQPKYACCIGPGFMVF